MEKYVTKIRTEHGDQQIDYRALANLPDLSSPQAIGAAPIEHVHDSATDTSSGFMGAADKKLVNALNKTNLGGFSNKTVADLRESLSNWLSTCLDYPNAAARFTAANNFIDYWNIEDTTSTIQSGGQWTVRVVASYYLNTYVLLELSTYTDKELYYVAKTNDSWRKIRKVAYKDEIPTLSTFGITVSADDINKLENLTATAEDLNKISELTAHSEELNYLSGTTKNIQEQLNSKASNTHKHDASDINSGTLDTSIIPVTPMDKGGTGSSNGATGLNNLFAAGPTVLSAYQYGDSLPAAGTVGRIFFKKVGN